MAKDKKIPSRILELELEIKLLEYLKNNKIIDDLMYNYSINKIITKINIVKNKTNNYKLVT